MESLEGCLTHTSNQMALNDYIYIIIEDNLTFVSESNNPFWRVHIFLMSHAKNIKLIVVVQAFYVLKLNFFHDHNFRFNK